jgi:hypothetical protein
MHNCSPLSFERKRGTLEVYVEEDGGLSIDWDERGYGYERESCRHHLDPGEVAQVLARLQRQAPPGAGS